MVKLRLFSGKILLKFSGLVDKITRFFCVLILKPDDLTALTRRCYNRSSSVAGAFQENYPDIGLNRTETYFIKQYLKPGAKILVVGCGGGRESIALARLGFKVTAADFAEKPLKAARLNASKFNLEIEFICEDISRLQFPEDKRFQAIMFPALLYSIIPSRRKRSAVLERCRSYLEPDGKILLSFFSRQNEIEPYERFKKIFALMAGNADYEPGDVVESDGSFIHYFSEPQMRGEIAASGFEAAEFNLADPQDSFGVLTMS